jgi:hypothetical protein
MAGLVPAISARLHFGFSREVFMLCYQVSVQFTFYEEPLGPYKQPVLVSTHIKKQNVRPFLVRSGLPFGSRLKYRRFFYTEKEAAQYVSYLHTVYKDRIIPNPAQLGGQFLFNFEK